MAQSKKNKINDVTKTGPQSYRQLQAANQEAYVKASQTSPFADLKLSGYTPSSSYIYEGGEYSPQYQQTQGENYWGKSMFDSDTANEEDYSRLDDIRSENQPALAQAVAGISKGIILAGTTFIDGTVGLLAGIGQAIYNGASDDENTHWYQGLWDNPVVNLMGQLNEASEELLPNYRTQAQQEAPWYSWDNLSSANFIFDTVVKNMGFTVGAAFAGGVYTKAIDWGAKALGLARLGQASAATIEAGQRAMQASNATRATKALVGSFFSAHAEAVQEAYNASQDFIKTETQRMQSRAMEQEDIALQEFVQNGGILLEDGSPDTINSDSQALATLGQRLSDIQQATADIQGDIVKQSKSVGTMDGLLNIPILWLSNVAMFGKMYSGGWKAARNANRTTTRATKEAMKKAKAAARAGDPSELNKLNEIVAKAEETGYQGLSQAEKAMVEEVAPHMLGKKMGTTWAAIKGPLREGNEEMLQGAAAQAAHHRYENEVDRIFDAKLNLESTYKTRGLMESILHGFISQYGNIDNYEEAFVGAITGLLGSPTFGKGNNSTDQTYLGKSKWIGLSGGTITEVRNYLRDRKNADLAAQHATEALRRETLSDDIKHLIAQTHFNDTMDRAVIHDDEKEYKDARTASIFEMVSHLKRAGRLDLLQRAMQTTTEFTEEDIAEIAESVSKEVSATTPDVTAKVQQKKRVEKEIETMLDTYSELLDEAMATGDSSKIDATDEMLKKKKAELARLEAEIAEAKPVSVSPYIHKDGTAFTQEEIKQDIDKRVKQFQKIIDTIALSQDQIDEATSGTLTNEQLDTLTWYKVMMSDWSERANGITEHWKQIINRLANDPQLISSIEAIQEVEDLLEEAGFDPSKADVQLGGRFDQLKKLKNYINILQQLQQAVDAGGLNLAYLLTSTIKPEGSEETVGEIISKQFKLALDTDTNTSKDIKDAFLKGLNDLKSIGQGHRKYNELLDEYLKNPDKIDQAHQASTNRAQAEESRQNISGIIYNINWDSPAGVIAKFLKDNASIIQNAGGFEKFIENLTPEQQQKARQVQQLVMGIDSLDTLIDQANLEDEQALLLRGVIDDNIEDSNTIEELANAVKESIQNGEIEKAIRNSIPEEQAEDLTLRQIEAAESALSEFLDDNLEKLVNAAEEAQRAVDAEQERIRRLAEQTTEQLEDEIGELASRTTEPQAPTEAPKEKEAEDNTDEADIPDVNPTSSTEAKKANKASRSPQAGQAGFNRKRQISQYYLQGDDRETLPRHYQEHPEDIPAGVDKQAFLKYINAVHKKLVESGAYTYISGVNPNLRLKEGQEIKFTTDTKLNEEAGVPVILMVVTDEQGHEQIIGSLPTSLDFQAKQRGGTKTVGEVHPEDKALYDALCDELLSKDKGNQNTDQLSLLTRVETALQNSDIRLWSNNANDNVVMTTTNEGFQPAKDSRLADTAGDFDFSNNEVGNSKKGATLKHRSKDGVDYVEVDNPKDGEVKSAIVIPTGPRIGDNITFHFYKKLSDEERDTIIKELKNKGNRNIQYINDLLQKLNPDVQYSEYAQDSSKLEQLRQKASEAQANPEGYVFSTITTKVEALMGGNPSFSAQNRSVAEVFGESEVPITIILESGPRSNKAVKTPLSVSRGERGQVFVYITTNNTNMQIPLRCISTPLKDLADNDWYIEQTIQAIQKTVDPLNIGSAKDSILRWLPFLKNLHINHVEKNGKKYVMFGWGINQSGEIVNTHMFKLQEDGSIAPKDALSFIKTISKRKLTTPSGKKIYPLTNVDRNQLNDKEYMSNITRYIKVNVTSDSPTTIDDWFTYAPTEIQKKGKRPSQVNPAITPSGKKPATEVIQTDKGQATVSSAGTITIEGDETLTEEEEAAILAGALKGIDISDIDRELNDAAINETSSSDIDEMPDTPRRRKRRKPKKNSEDKNEQELDDSGKALLVSEVQGESIASRASIQEDIDKLSSMFPKMAQEGRIVLVKGLIEVVNQNGNPEQAYGLFRNGVLYISDQSPKGTAFHEAFHYITDSLLDSSEKKIMFEEASKMFGNLPQIGLEEKLSEEFRQFMNERQDHSIKGRLKNIFQKLKHIVLSIVGRENYLDNLFWSIYRNKMQNRTDNTSQDIFKQELLKYKTKKLKYSNLDQETKDYLKARDFSEENYEKLSIEQKELLLQCM